MDMGRYLVERPTSRRSSPPRSSVTARLRRCSPREVVMLIADRDIRVITPDGELLRQLTLEPTRDYQPQSAGWISTMS